MGFKLHNLHFSMLVVAQKNDLSAVSLFFLLFSFVLTLCKSPLLHSEMMHSYIFCG